MGVSISSKKAWQTFIKIHKFLLAANFAILVALLLNDMRAIANCVTDRHLLQLAVANISKKKIFLKMYSPEYSLFCFKLQPLVNYFVATIFNCREIKLKLKNL